MNLYKMADLTTIWADVEVFEHQIEAMRVGQRARVELPYLPGRPYTGFVRYLYPHFDERTRTMTVSIELENPDLTLRAGMYANVTFDVPGGAQRPDRAGGGRDPRRHPRSGGARTFSGDLPGRARHPRPLRRRGVGGAGRGRGREHDRRVGAVPHRLREQPDSGHTHTRLGHGCAVGHDGDARRRTGHVGHAHGAPARRGALGNAQRQAGHAGHARVGHARGAPARRGTRVTRPANGTRRRCPRSTGTARGKCRRHRATRATCRTFRPATGTDAGPGEGRCSPGSSSGRSATASSWSSRRCASRSAESTRYGQCPSTRCRTSPTCR